MALVEKLRSAAIVVEHLVGIQQGVLLVVVHLLVAVQAPEGGVLGGVPVVVRQLLCQGLIAGITVADGVRLLHIGGWLDLLG